MSFTTPDRSDLAKFIEDARTLIAFEELFDRVAELLALPRPVYTQSAPVAVNTTSTLLSSVVFGGLITSTHATGATITLTLPTGTLLDEESDIEIGQAFEWSIINIAAAAADTVTVAAGTDNTIVGAVLIPSAHATTGGLNGTNSARFLSRKTAANTFVTYRL